MAHELVERFTIAVPDEVVADLKVRLARTRGPGEVRDSRWNYGTNLSYLRDLVEYWRTRYDWRARDRELNRFAHFKADIEGLPIHFIHQAGAGRNPVPLMGLRAAVRCADGLAQKENLDPGRLRQAACTLSPTLSRKF
jgi:hypothetical protein